MLLLVLTVAMHGQIKCRIEHYSTEDGLSHNAVTGIIKSSDGFMWFGTWDGINRFDGHNFVTCKSHPGDSSGLKSNRIDIIFDRIIPTSGEKVWLTTTNQGVFCVKSVAAASPGITRYSPGMPGVFQLRADVIKFLCAGETNNIWIGTEKGLLGLSLNEAEVYKKKYINLNNLNNQDFTCVTKDNEHI